MCALFEILLGSWHWSLTTTNLKDLAEVFAFLSTGIYFLYHLRVGYFLPDLSLRLVCVRQSALQVGNDYLRVGTVLSKGERGSLHLHDSKARVTWEGGQLVKSLTGTSRLSFTTENLDGKERKVIDFSQSSKRNPLLRLTPGEKTQFSAFFQVPNNAVCQVEVVVIGSKPSSDRIGQWRASAISLPLGDH